MHINKFKYISILLLVNILLSSFVKKDEKPLPLTITPNDYDLSCTHPDMMDEFYSQTQGYAAAAIYPIAIPSKGLGLLQHTYIPLNIYCGALGEQIQDFVIQLNLNHNDFSDLELRLHAPASMNIAPMILATSGQLATTNSYQASTSLINDFNSLIDTPTEAIGSPIIEANLIETVGSQIPTNFGNNWYLQLTDTNSPIGNAAYGGTILNDVSVNITSGFPFPYTITGCCVQSVTLLNEIEQETNCDQSDWNGSIILRTWEATDDMGQTATCVQTVDVKAPQIDDIELPSNINIECIGQTADDFIPALTGKPTFNCFDIEDDQYGLCDISYSYEDNVFPICANSFVILRQWTIVNWCSGQSIYQSQTITIEDTLGPSVQNNLTINTNNCSESIDLSTLVSSDACSGLMSASASYVSGGGLYDSNSPNLVTVDLMSPVLETFQTGLTEVYIEARDSCLNDTNILVPISIIENTPPTVACISGVSLPSINGNGCVEILPSDVIASVVDNCTSDTELIANAKIKISGSTDAFESVLTICCGLSNIDVDISVGDRAGNTTVCSSTVFLPVLPNCCPSTLQVNAVPIMDNSYEAYQSLSSFGQIPSSGNVFFQAGQTICLDSGFEVELGASFEAIIEACPTGLQGDLEGK